MTCAAEKLYQLEFVVKTLTRCGRPEDEGCCTAVCIRFLGNQEQTVCEIPAPADCAASAVTSVNAGNKYTFAMTSDGRCDPRSLRVAVRLHRVLGADTLPNRVELASGDLEVPLTPKPDERRRRRPATGAGGACAVDCDDGAAADNSCEMTVPMTSCHDGRTIAVLVVRARVWCVGPMMAAPIACPVPCPVPCPAPCSVPCPIPCGSRPASRPQQAAFPVPCSGRPASQPMQATCPVSCSPPPDPCGRKKPPCACDCCRKKPPCACESCRKKTTVSCCPTGCPQPRPCRRPCGTCPAPAASGGQCPQQQYETVSCEIDGHKMDLRVRKKNFETCSVQRRLANEADAFACRVMRVVKDMHGFVADSSNGGNAN